MATSEISTCRYSPGRTSVVNLLVIHDTEGPYSNTAAEALKNWMKTCDSVSGYHYAYDTDSEVDLVDITDTAWGAGGVNFRSVHLSVCGKALSIPWADFFTTPGGQLFILRSARICLDLKIPVNHLTPEEVRDGVAGICGHGDVSVYFPKSQGHTDPAPNFPWQDFINRVRYICSLETEPPPLPPPSPNPGGHVKYLVVSGDYLTLIAQKCYGVTSWSERQNVAAEISKANGGITDQQLKPGIYLTLPGHMVL